MKYKGREVIDFSVGIQLGKDKIGKKLLDFKNNEKFVAKILTENNILGWQYVEAPVDDLVVIMPTSNNIVIVNQLYSDVKKIYDNATIQILYDNFDENGHNLEDIQEVLDIQLLTA